MRNISFSLTTPQIRAGQKTVTRRVGWKFLRPGQRLMACVKSRGLPLGASVERIREIEVVNVRREPLGALLEDEAYGAEECRREGFPELTPAAFVETFCQSHRGCRPSSEVTRIEFRFP